MNLLSDIPAQLSQELIEKIVDREHVRIERIVSTGHRSPENFWYDQVEHEWVVVLQGQAVLRFEDESTVQLGPGDAVNIPAHRRHRVDWTSTDEPTVWLAIFYR